MHKNHAYSWVRHYIQFINSNRKILSYTVVVIRKVEYEIITLYVAVGRDSWSFSH